MDRDEFFIRQGGFAIAALIYGDDARIAAWTANLIPWIESFGPCVTIGVPSQGRLIAGIVYSEYRPQNGVIMVSIAAISPMWARKEIIAELLRYPFEQLGVYKVFSAMLLSNEKALRVNAHIGFKREAILAHHFGRKRHAVITRMLRPDYDRIFGVG